MTAVSCKEKASKKKERPELSFFIGWLLYWVQPVRPFSAFLQAAAYSKACGARGAALLRRCHLIDDGQGI